MGSMDHSMEPVFYGSSTLVTLSGLHSRPPFSISDVEIEKERPKRPKRPNSSIGAGF